MKDVYATLLALERTTKKNEKLEILSRNGTPELQRTLLLALSPFMTFGIKQLPEHLESGDGDFNEGSLVLLHKLSNRQLTGHSARDAVSEELSRLAPEDREVFKRILLKDLRAGIDAKSVNKVFPYLVPVFSCMLAEPFDAARVRSFPVLVQPKLDGVRVLVRVDPVKSHVDFLSRSGKEFTSFDDLKEPMLEVARRLYGPFFPDGPIMLDGEVTSGDFLTTVGDVRRKNKKAENAFFHLFDALPAVIFEDPKLESLSQRTRYEVLRAQVGREVPRVAALEGEFVGSVEEIYEIYDRVRDQGLEGVIVKDPQASYELRRSYSWMKIKDCQSVDVPIVDVVQGTGKYAHCAGAIVVDVEGVQVSVGSGLSDVQREELWALFQESPEELLGRIVEVQFHERTAYGSLRHPRFVRFRDALTGSKE